MEDQATDRAFRIGQRRDVQVRKFVCVGTLEERIDAMIEEKKALAERIVGTGEGWLTELSVAELRKLIDAVAGGGVGMRPESAAAAPGRNRSRPRRVEGGIGRAASAARSASSGGRGGSSTCWSRSGMSGRLARGRNYARAGPGARARARPPAT